MQLITSRTRDDYDRSWVSPCMLFVLLASSFLVLRLFLGRHLDLLLLRLALFSLHLILRLPTYGLLFLARSLSLHLPGLILLPTGLFLYLLARFPGLDPRRILLPVLAAPITFPTPVDCRLILLFAAFATRRGLSFPGYILLRHLLLPAFPFPPILSIEISLVLLPAFAFGVHCIKLLPAFFPFPRAVRLHFSR